MGSGISKGGQEAAPLATLAEHQGGINCMAMSKDGSLLVTGSDDKTVRMWNIKTEPTECLGVLQGHTSFIQCAAVYDTYVITGSKDATIRKWDTLTAQCDFTYEGHEARINRIICTGEFILSTSHDKTARAWLFDMQDVPQQDDDASIRSFQGHTGVVSPIIFIPGPDTGGPDKLGFNINPADLVVTGSFDNTARVWSLDSGRCLKTLKGHKNPIICMDTDPKGNILYTAGEDKTIIAWDIAMGRIIKKVEEAHRGAVLYLRVVNRLMYTTSTDHTAKCWVREGLESTRTYRHHTDSVVCAKFHDGILYTVCNDGLVRAFDAKSGSLKRKFKGHEYAVTCLTVCATQDEGEVRTKLFTGGNDSTIRVWKVSDLSDEIPTVVPATDHDDDGSQNKRLDELDRHLDGYMTSDTASKSSVRSTEVGSKCTITGDD